MKKTLIYLMLGLVVLSLCGCLNVQPWDRDKLAKPEMAFDPRPVDFANRQHMYFSREATSGGYGASGGGCGCN